MRVELYEKLFLWLTGATMAVFLAAIFAGLLLAGHHVPAPAGRVDPKRLAETPPFDRPGVVQVGPGRYEATMIAQIWAFNPNEIRVPAGSTVTFRIASRDVLHGLKILNTNVNLMIVPGEVSTLSYTFRAPGEYLMVCHEYCGVGHQGMFGKVIVGPAAAGAAGAAS